LWFRGFREWSIPVVDRDSPPSIIRFVVLEFMDFRLGNMGSNVNPCVGLDLSICPRRYLMEVWFHERFRDGYKGERVEINRSMSGGMHTMKVLNSIICLFQVTWRFPSSFMCLIPFPVDKILALSLN